MTLHFQVFLRTGSSREEDLGDHSYPESMLYMMPVDASSQPLSSCPSQHNTAVQVGSGIFQLLKIIIPGAGHETGKTRSY
jgi:hypothetical protein